MKILVVTGGIGSGKSQVCTMLNELYGFAVYDADSRVKGLYESETELLDSIESSLDQTFRTDTGLFSPALLAARIFNDPAALEQVERLVFPALIRDFNIWAESHKDDRYVVFESATILEKEQFKGFGDVIMLVDAPVRLRLERACMRDSASEERVFARMARQKLMNQYSDGLAVPDVDVVIENTGDIEELKNKVVVQMDALLNMNINNI